MECVLSIHAQKNRPDSLTNQRLPGINEAKIVFFFLQRKFLPTFLKKKLQTSYFIAGLTNMVKAKH